MNCEFCESKFSSKQSLNHHKRTAKYCLSKQEKKVEFICEHCKKIFTTQRWINIHKKDCIQYLLNNQKKEYLTELKIIQEQYNSKIYNLEKILEEKNETIKKLEDRMHSLLVKAVSRPTVSDNRIQQTINNLIPLTDDHLSEQAEFLTLDHIKQGALGYANFACDYALKDRITCVDIARRKVKYKNSDGQIVTDPEMNVLSRKLFTSIKDKNTKLTNQYKGELRDMILKKYMESGNDINDEETKELETTIDQMNKEIQEASNLYYQTMEITDGKKPDIYHDFIREVCNKTVNKLI